MYELKKATAVFTEPAGGAANASYISEKVSDKLEFEIFNRSGERRTINRESLKHHASRDALANEIRAWVQT